MVFGSKRETKPDSLSREDVVGNLYPDSLTSEVDVAQPASEFPRGGDRGNECVIDPHARFNGKYVSDRDLRIEGEAQGEIECQGTLIISPQARVRSAIKAAQRDRQRRLRGRRRLRRPLRDRLDRSRQGQHQDARCWS